MSRSTIWKVNPWSIAAATLIGTPRYRFGQPDHGWPGAHGGIVSLSAFRFSSIVEVRSGLGTRRTIPPRRTQGRKARIRARGHEQGSPAQGTGDHSHK